MITFLKQLIQLGILSPEAIMRGISPGRSPCMRIFPAFGHRQSFYQINLVTGKNVAHDRLPPGFGKSHEIAPAVAGHLDLDL